MLLKYLPIGIVALVMAVTPLFPQQIVPGIDAKPLAGPSLRLPAVPVPGCAFASTAELTFHNRLCYEASSLLSTGASLRAVAFAGYHQFGRTFDRHKDDFETYLEYFYTRRAANRVGELVAGALNREPLVHEASGQTGFWKRSRAAVLTVVRVEDDRSSRPALGPIAGSFASGFSTMACCTYHQSAADALRRSGETYAGYFATALFHEFKPDLKSYAKRKFHR